MNDVILSETNCFNSAMPPVHESQQQPSQGEPSSDVLMRICNGQGTLGQVALPMSVVFAILRASA